MFWDWIKPYLTNRKQKVVLNGASLEWSRVYSGVPQGSVLGPLLFSIYANDIPSIVDSQTLMFADDTKIVRRIQSQMDFHQFQQDINNLFAWSVKWQLKFNVSKCFRFHLGSDHPFGNYYLDGVQVSPTNTVKDLGVNIDSLLKFHKHTNLTVSKANRALRLIRKTFQCREQDTVVREKYAAQYIHFRIINRKNISSLPVISKNFTGEFYLHINNFLTRFLDEVSGNCGAIFDNMETCERNSCVRGYHVYKDIWDAVIGEELVLYVKGSPITEAIDMQLPLGKTG